jgi:beta-glucosidase
MSRVPATVFLGQSNAHPYCLFAICYGIFQHMSDQSRIDLAGLKDDFLWGASTAAYQIEGAVNEDGRGPSIWDTFCHTPGKIENGDTGDVACDHYHRYREDVKLMAELGLNAYRFSVAWPRIFPTGRGKLNVRGIDFYQRLIDELLTHQIEPWICLYHWDLPQELQDIGGWTNRDAASWFTDYAIAVAEQLGDRVKHWVMQNEPSIVTFLGYTTGVHAPGIQDLEATFATMHHLNLALGMALTALRAAGGDWELGTVLNISPAIPVSDADEAVTKLHDDLFNHCFLEPVFRGTYPASVRSKIEKYVQSGDLGTIQHPMDFLGLNYYFPSRVVTDGGEPLGYRMVDPPADSPKTGLGWEIRAESFTELILDLGQKYRLPPLYITENGAAFRDEPDNKGAIQDDKRIDYLDRHVAAVVDARKKGADVRGYFVWSLLDNFEWAFGYWPRFGLVYVDYGTLQRIPKESFSWFGDLIRRTRER